MLTAARALALIIIVSAAGCAHGSTGASVAASPSPTLPITSGVFPEFGHAPDFTWLSGRLIRSVPVGQCTYLQFSTHRGEPWGGRIALVAGAGDPAPFPDGDMVVVTGVLQTRAPSACGQPAILVSTIAEH